MAPDEDNNRTYKTNPSRRSWLWGQLRAKCIAKSSFTPAFYPAICQDQDELSLATCAFVRSPVSSIKITWRTAFLMTDKCDGARTFPLLLLSVVPGPWSLVFGTTHPQCVTDGIGTCFWPPNGFLPSKDKSFELNTKFRWEAELAFSWQMSAIRKGVFGPNVWLTICSVSPTNYNVHICSTNY